MSESGRCKMTPNATMKITATSHKTSQIECSKIETNYIESTWYFLSHFTLLLRVASLSMNSPTKIMRTDPSLSSRYEMQFTLIDLLQNCADSSDDLTPLILSTFTRWYLRSVSELANHSVECLPSSAAFVALPAICGTALYHAIKSRLNPSLISNDPSATEFIPATVNFNHLSCIITFLNLQNIAPELLFLSCNLERFLFL